MVDILKTCLPSTPGGAPKRRSGWGQRQSVFLGLRLAPLVQLSATFPPACLLPVSASHHQHPLHLPPFCGRLRGQGSLCGYQPCFLAGASRLGFNSDRCVYKVRRDMYIPIPFSSMEFKYVCNTEYERSPTTRFWVVFTL